MNGRRVLAAAVVVVALAAVAAFGLFGYSPASGASTTPFEPTAPGESYEASMTLWTNGERFLEYTARDDRDDDQQLVIQRFENGTYSTYWNGSHALRHVDADRRREYDRFLRTGDDERLLSRDDDALRATVLETDGDPPLADREQPAGLLGATLGQPDYERTGTATYAGEEAAVYRPASTWRDSSSGPGAGRGFRITNAAGEVYVDPETGTLYYADVRYDFVRADSWGRYLYERYAGEGAATVEITYEYDPGPVDVTEPGWTESE